MTGKRILVVEDSKSAALYARNTLIDLGYEIADFASNGNDALLKTEETFPDLVLMDIVLEGNMDGVETAEKIRRQYNIPVVFLTSQSDEITLQRAKITEAFGYIHKPYDRRSLHTTIEMAIYKYEIEKKLKESEQRLSTTLASIKDAVVSISVDGLVTFLNPVAEQLTGWQAAEAIGKGVKKIVDFRKSDKNIVSGLLQDALKNGGNITLGTNVFLISDKDKELPVSGGISPMCDIDGNIQGMVLVFRDITERLRAEQEHIEKGKLVAVLETAGAICHEISSPLQSVTGYVELTMNEINGETHIKNRLDKLLHKMALILQKLRNITKYQTTDYVNGIKIIDIHKASMQR